MTRALFRLALADGTTRWAAGTIESGPASLLRADASLASLLGGPVEAIPAALAQAETGGLPVPGGAHLLAPVDAQEIWAAGVTYERSRDARMEESDEPSVYDHVYEAVRPELFFKAVGWRVRAPGDPIGIRRDSGWDVPEPELGLVVTARMEVAGYVLGNDVSSRTIEGENPLYLPQAKVYDGSCSLGPAIVPVSEAEPPFAIRLVVERENGVLLDETTSTIRIRRSFDELVEHLGRALKLPAGAVLLTGTGVVPDPSFTLREGDVVRIESEPLGLLENRVELVGRRAAQAGGSA
jgi:2-dehydro-3-deoxy-D-arabinonate dehydratase